jgi:hypothetical protein
MYQKLLKLHGTLINTTLVLEDYDRLQIAFHTPFLLQLEQYARDIAVFLNRWDAPCW